MRASVTQLQEEYNHYLNVNSIGRSRERRNVMARFAFMVASRDLYTIMEIAKVVQKNHAVVIHATKAHEPNLRFDTEYVRFYQQTTNIIDKLRGQEQQDSSWELQKQYAATKDRLNDIRSEVVLLREEIRNKDKLIKELKYELSD